MAATDNKIKGTVRTELGKGSARRARRAGLVPAVVYGHGLDPIHLELPGHEIFLIVKDNVNAVISVSYDDEQQLTLVKDIQRHPVRRDILHVDLLAVRATERVEVEVPIIIIGEPVPGSQLQQEEFSVLLSAPAISIPESIEVDISELAIGTVVLAGDLALPEGSEIDEELVDRDVLSIIELQEIEEEEDDLEEAEAEVEEATEED